MTNQTRLIDGLRHTLEAGDKEVTIRETHISWVLLAGERAWKIKKQVNFGFLDFSTLEKRKLACEEELRLNRRFAPEIYLDVVAIYGTPDQPSFKHQADVIEYAVHMQRFDESGLLSELAKNRLLKQEHIDSAARLAAHIHQQAAVASQDCPWGQPDQIHRWLLESLEHIKGLVDQADEINQVARIDRFSNRLYGQLYDTFRTRNESGFIRECHGDLHLRNMTWIDQKLLPFDCIEFNPALRWIDVISEVAFVMMDLQDRGYPAFAWHFINHYISITGDYQGLGVLRYYACYRALVRAKVILLQMNELETPEDKKPLLYAQYADYANLAEQWLTSVRPALIIMHGLSASGKSTVARHLAERYGCIHIRSDIERKRLHGLSTLEDSHAGTSSGIYISSASDKTYHRLYELAKTVLNANFPVIIDATFLKRSRREHFQQLAGDAGCPFLIVHCEASRDVLEARIIKRAQQGQDPSEATLAVLNSQVNKQDHLIESEHYTVIVDNAAPTLPETFVDILISPSTPVG